MPAYDLLALLSDQKPEFIQIHSGQGLIHPGGLLLSMSRVPSVVVHSCCYPVVRPRFRVAVWPQVQPSACAGGGFWAVLESAAPFARDLSGSHGLLL